MRRSWLWALGAYTLLALLLTWPLAAHFTTHTAGDGIDDPALAWNLWWVKVRLVDQLNPDLFHSGWMFHPVNINLAFYTLTPLNGLLSLPLQGAFGLTVANNLLLLSSFVLGGFGTYLLVLQSLGPQIGPQIGRQAPISRTRTSAVRVAALVAGGMYAFASAKLFYAALGQFNIASSQWIPFCALYLVRLAVARTPGSRLRAAMWAGFFAVLQAWAELTYASFLLILIALFAAWLLIFGPDAGAQQEAGLRGRLRLVPPILLMAAIFVLGLLPFLAAMAPDLLSEGDFFGSGGGFADVFSADLLGYLFPTRLHPWLGSLAAGLPFPNDKGQHIFAGYIAVLLALAGSVVLWRHPGGRRWFWFWVPALLLFWLLTLGPQLRWAGQPLPLAGPFALVSQLPFFSGNRYPSRYSVLLLLALAVLAGVGLASLLGRPQLVRRRGMAWVVGGTLIGLLLFEQLSLPLPLSDQRVPPIYRRIAGASPPQTPTLLELPTGWRNGARVLGKSDLLIMAQQWWQTEHGLRRLGGNTSRNPEFKFQYFTEAPLIGDLIALFNANEAHLAPVIDAQLEEMIERNRQLAPRVLRFLGVEFVTVHVEKSPPQLLRFVEEALPLTLVAEESTPAAEGAQTIRLYRVEPDKNAPPATVQTAGYAMPIEMDGPWANLHLAEGWSPGVFDAPVRYATRRQPRLLLDLPQEGGRVVLEWAAPPGDLQATVNGVAVAAIADTAGQIWTFDVPAGVADLPVDEVQLRLEGEGQAAAQVAVQAGGNRRVGGANARLPDNVSLLVRSAGQEVGDFAHIWLNGVDVAGGERGYNLIALDPQGLVRGQATFDTLASADASAAMADWLQQWPAGTVVAGAVADEASLQLGQDAVDALRGLGVLTDLRGRFRWSHAFIGVAGAEPGAALEAAGLLQPAQVNIGPALDWPRVYGELLSIVIEPKE